MPGPVGTLWIGCRVYLEQVSEGSLLVSSRWCCESKISGCEKVGNEFKCSTRKKTQPAKKKFARRHGCCARRLGHKRGPLPRALGAVCAARRFFERARFLG